MSMRDWARRLGVGRALYRLKKMRRDGFVYTGRHWWASRRMERAAMRLRPQALPELDLPGSVIYLTGRQHWFQAAFCLYSLQHQLGGSLRRVVFVSDGSLEGSAAESLRRIFPASRVVGQAEVEGLIEEQFPPERFPVLRSVRRRYLHLRKVVDVRLADPGPGILLDSDMLFHAPPAEILAWLKSPGAPLFMRDRQPSYGADRELLEEICGAPIPEPVNSGVVALDRGAVHWETVEHMLARLVEKRDVNFYTEQALHAMMMAPLGGRALDPARYIVRPEGEVLAACSAPLHHYTWTSRLPYLEGKWRRFLT